ncbi:MAG TPA: chemotaxis protein CheC [Candidatus Thermoplasmatota archaeon]|nr:chemotaxis protein CheC [Candidatus Thermoplasmatota archaeon]
MGNSLSLSEYQQDALREVANIMVGHATTALARLSNQRIDITIPSIEVLSMEEGLAFASGASGIVAGVRTRLLGRISGEMFIIFPRESAFSLSDVVRGLPPDHTRYLNPSAASALVEVGNVIAGACLGAFYQLLDISLIHSVPEFVYDVPNALVAAERAQAPDEHMVVATVAFRSPDIHLAGSLMLLFSVESMVELVDALEIRT